MGKQAWLGLKAETCGAVEQSRKSLKHMQLFILRLNALERTRRYKHERGLAVSLRLVPAAFLSPFSFALAPDSAGPRKFKFKWRS